MGFIVKGVKKVVKAAVGIVSKVGKILGPVVGLGKKKTAKTSTNLRLGKDLTPETYRKIVFGQTASALDLRFWQVWGAKGTNYDEVLALASHRIHSVKSLYFEDELAINDVGVVQPKFVGVVNRDVRLGAYNQTAMSVGDGTQWNANSTFDGVAHMKLAWTPTEKNLPNGVPSRYTQVICGAPVYDPRRDSTAGGFGSHRIDDRNTWDYAAVDPNGYPIGRNNALQVLWYLLGWYIPNKQTGEQILVAGRGIEPSDINIATFITAANNCEAAGYYTDMVLSTEDPHTSNEDKITGEGLIGQLIDTGGLWSYYANVDDTANVALYLTDADVIQGGSVTWNEYQGISEQYQQVSGKFIDPSPNALFQLNGYPMVRDVNYENLTGLKRRKTQDFEVVQDVVLAQKLARLLLNMGQYQAEFAAPFMYRALQAQAWSIVRYTSERFGWSKLFRVYRYDITGDNGGIEMLLKEIDPSIWSAGSVTQPIAPSAGQKYDPRQEIIATGIGWASQSVGNNGVIQDGVIFFWSEPPPNVKYTEVRYRKVGGVYWQQASPAKGDNFVSVVPIVSGLDYEFQVRHISIHEVDGPWMPQPSQVFTGGTDSRMPWDYVSDPNATRPQDNATKGAPVGTVVANRLAEEIVDSLDINSNAILAEALRQDDFLVLLDARTLIDGQAVSAQFLDFRNQITDQVSGYALASDFEGVFAKSPTTTGYTLNLQTVKAGNATLADLFNGYNFSIGSLTQGVGSLNNQYNGLFGDLSSLSGSVGVLSRNLTETTAKVGTVTADVTELHTAFATDGGGFASFALRARVDNNGVIGISGISGIVNGGQSSLNFVADQFAFVIPNGGNPIKPFYIVGNSVYTTNLVADTITYGSLVQRFTDVGQQNLNLNGWYQVLPGGLIMQGGRYRGPINYETTFSVVWPRPFPNAILSRGAMPFLNVFNNERDLWLQNVGEPTLQGATFATQSSTKNDQQLDGFDWWAWGK